MGILTLIKTTEKKKLKIKNPQTHTHKFLLISWVFFFFYYSLGSPGIVVWKSVVRSEMVGSSAGSGLK